MRSQTERETMHGPDALPLLEHPKVLGSLTGEFEA